MQNLNTQKVANDRTDMKIVSVFESLLAEDKKAYRWWHEDLKTAEPTMDRTDWATVNRPERIQKTVATTVRTRGGPGSEEGRAGTNEAER